MKFLQFKSEYREIGVEDKQGFRVIKRQVGERRTGEKSSRVGKGNGKERKKGKYSTGKRQEENW